MKFKDISSMTDANRKKTLKEAKAELVKLNGQVATGTTPKSPGQIGELKKTIAKILTFENQKTEEKSVKSEKKD